MILLTQTLEGIQGEGICPCPRLAAGYLMTSKKKRAINWNAHVHMTVRTSTLLGVTVTDAQITGVNVSRDLISHYIRCTAVFSQDARSFKRNASSRHGSYR